MKEQFIEQCLLILSREDIKKELKNVINQCKMRGEDHDQYHIVLHAMLTEAKELINKKGLFIAS